MIVTELFDDPARDASLPVFVPATHSSDPVLARRTLLSLLFCQKMVKATKKQPVNHGKPITSFFSKAPKPPASSPSVPSSSQGTPSSRKDNQNTNVQASLNTRIKNATELEALDSAWASTVPSGRSKTDISMQADAAYLKRARSPDSLFSSPLVFERPQTPGPPRAEIGKADIDLDTINTV